MSGAPLPSDEGRRLEALRRSGLLDTPPESAFDDIARIASLVAGTPIALVSLIDERRQWFKARVGLDATETPREQAFCGYTILGREPFVVPDATKDARFAENPLVTGPPRIAFYAGVPIVTADGHALGSLCVIDRRPRELSPEQLGALRALERRLVAELELRAAARDLARLHGEARDREALLRAFHDGTPDAIVTIDGQGSIVGFNPAAERMFGWSADEAKGQPITVLVPEKLRGEIFRYMGGGRSHAPGTPAARGPRAYGLRRDGSTFPAD
ncbi:MAG TPA: GAF domain-containing protein, partial [Planctomycetota bacterium]|nr:GAF domain-containing protein [Planctomycetota bacterium]